MATSLIAQHRTKGGSATKLGLRGSAEPKRVRLRGSGKRDQLDDTSMTPSSDDPLRILAPGQKKLSTIESQRVLAVIEEAIKRMKNAMLIPIFAGSLDRYSVPLGVEVVVLLDEYIQLSTEYNRLYLELEQQGIPPDLDIGNDPADIHSLSGQGVIRSGSVTSLTSAGHPTHLEPLVQEQGPEATEARFRQVRFKLKHCVKCIFRALQKNASTSSLITTTSSAPKNITLLQEEMR
jgi:hypothetical protein